MIRNQMVNYRGTEHTEGNSWSLGTRKALWGYRWLMFFYLGIDFGTSGARAIAIDQHNQIQAQTLVEFEESHQTADLWQHTLFTLIEQLPLAVRQQTQAIAVNGTSGTVLLCDTQGQPVSEPLLYNDARAVEVMDQVRAIAPPKHTVLSPTSSLAKLLWLMKRWRDGEAGGGWVFLHQADWLGFLLHGRLGISDYHNALKLGYDVKRLGYPDWLQQLSLPLQLPQVVAPGAVIGQVRQAVGDRFHLPPSCIVRAGTTDSIAAFLASGANSPGAAVTSLGSTLVLKLLSHTRIENADYGLYSHRLGDLWLVGGASNTGGAVLRQFFSNAELLQLSAAIPTERESSLDYYPLIKPGERFPVNDPGLPPRLTPRPADPVEFLHGLLESMARIEAKGYALLQQLGATPLTCVYTAGGGAKNQAWTKLRSRHLGLPILPSQQTQAAYGTALLAKGDLAHIANK